MDIFIKMLRNAREKIKKVIQKSCSDDNTVDFLLLLKQEDSYCRG